MSEEVTDGRRLRAVRTRANILKALLELLDEGDADPTAAAIAERAGVALRSIAQHFATREQLLSALAQTHLARLPDVPRLEGSFADRLARFVAVRSKSLEASVALRRVGLSAQGRSEAISTAFAAVARRRREELQQAFAPELARAPAWTFEALDALSSGTTWDTLRTTQRLPLKAAREVLHQAVAKLLG